MIVKCHILEQGSPSASLQPKKKKIVLKQVYGFCVLLFVCFNLLKGGSPGLQGPEGKVPAAGCAEAYEQQTCHSAEAQSHPPSPPKWQPRRPRQPVSHLRHQRRGGEQNAHHASRGLQR